VFFSSTMKVHRDAAPYWAGKEQNANRFGSGFGSSAWSRARYQ
jgi:hypothetical protein